MYFQKTIKTVLWYLSKFLKMLNLFIKIVKEIGREILDIYSIMFTCERDFSLSKKCLGYNFEPLSGLTIFNTTTKRER